MRIVKSPVERWPGTVTFKEPIPLSDVIALEKAMREARKLTDEKGIITEEYTIGEYHQIIVPSLRGCIEEYDIPGLDLDKWPGAPKSDAVDFTSWVITQVMSIYAGEVVPLE